ncbi:MAG: toxin-antitoxin system HicB family antitoxin [Deltaproteobacteria bacterium]|nr:toxin-antitoxin system HicB family antitoxin [Deltaproteobacteria bacterium]
METKKGKKEDQEDSRLIHVRLPVEIHKKLRIKTAEEDTTIQQWVTECVSKELLSENKQS